MKKTKKKINIKLLIRQLMLSALYLAVFAGIGAFVAYNSVYGNPDKTVEQIYGSYAAGNWSQFYELSTVKESRLVNLTTFVNAMQNSRMGVIESSIERESVKESNDNVEINVVYNTYEEVQRDTIRVVKTDEKKYKLFPVWKVDLSRMVVEDVAIKVPYGYKVTIDGIDISDVERLYFPEEQMMKYYIDRIFVGTHALTMTKEGMQDINEYINFSENGVVCEVSQDKVIVKEELAKNAPEIVFGLYRCALESKGTAELLDYFTDSGCKTLQDIYDKLYQDINAEDGAYLRVIENVEYDVSTDNSVEGKSVDVLVHFTCTYWAKTPRNMNSGVRKDYEGSAESTVVIHYVVSEGQYIADGMDFECIDYEMK